VYLGLKEKEQIEQKEASTKRNHFTATVHNFPLLFTTAQIIHNE